MSVDTDLMQKLDSLPEGLRSVVDEFRSATPRERLELLLEYANDLPALPPELAARRGQMEQVHECQTPVFLFTEVNKGRVHFHLDIPPEAPTVRGYASILAEGLDGVTPEQVMETPEDVYMLLGLQEAITPQRLRGLHALLVYMKRQVQKLM
jgi:cysteine desulfuration protein SufE